MFEDRIKRGILASCVILVKIFKRRSMRFKRLTAFILMLGPAWGWGMTGEGAREGRIKIYNVAAGRIEEVAKVVKTDAEWKKILTPEQYQVTRQRGTERPFTGGCALPPRGGAGIYQCVCCGTDLFRYETKFESGTGWPSFWESVSPLNVRLLDDDSSGMRRIEVLCSRCDAHLGHVFDDGPAPTGRRFCINAVALRLAPVAEAPASEETAAFGAGCFWGVEEAFSKVEGVKRTTAGYMGGTLKDPAYEDVSSGKTGHAEVVEVVYDPRQVSYEKLLDIFWDLHDPTTPNRQGPDVGTQYRSVIFTYTPAQEEAARLSKERLEKSHRLRLPVVTQISAAGPFYKAEDYHQQYFLRRTPRGSPRE